MKTAVLACATLLCIVSFAQNKTAAGYYISDQGDTVKGTFSNYSHWSKNPSAVEFTGVALTKSIKLTPQNCQKFVIDGYDEYAAYVGPRLINPVTDYEVLNDHYTNSSDTLENVQTFLRLVTKTPGCELYVLTDNKRSNFFYRLPGQSMVELKYKKFCYVSELTDIYTFELKNVITTSEYKDQLNRVFGDIIEKQKRSAALQNLHYSEHELRRFVENLFAVKRSNYQRKDPASGWIISAGTALNFIDVRADKSFTSFVKAYRSSVSPLLTIGYTMPASRTFSNYFLYPQLGLFKFENTGEINDGTFRKVATYKSDLVFFGEMNGGYNLVNLQNLRMYLSGGAGLMGFVNNRRLDVKYLNSQPSTVYGSEETDIALKATPSINASAGMVVTNKFLVSATYLFRTQIDNAFNYTPRYSGLQLKIGYKFK